MSRFGRAVEKAEREGLLTWTRGGDAPRRAAAVEEPPAPPLAPHSPPSIPTSRLRESTPLREEDIWGTTTEPEAPLSRLLVVATEPTSSAAEQYRLLRTRLEGRDQTRRSQLLIVSSPGIGDGKTTTSANLALSMAEESAHRVVLVEADLRRPRLAELFGVRAEPGLMDVLVGAATLDEALVTVPGSSLCLLSAGLPGSHPAGLLGSPLMQRCVEALRGRFDRIVVDTAPLALADTHVLTRLADGVLMIVKAGVTPRPALERALAGIDQPKVMGIVLNDVDDTATPYAEAAPPLRGTGA
jgi:capsular exopolysaccharide synthesis family protein